MDTTRLIAITVFTAWILAALAVAITVVVSFNSSIFDIDFNGPYETNDVGTVQISDTALTVSDLTCELVEDERVRASGKITNTGSQRSRSLTTIVRLNGSEGTELYYFRTPLFSSTRLGPLTVGQEKRFEISGRLAQGAETCEVEFWEDDERTQLSGETTAEVR